MSIEASHALSETELEAMRRVGLESTPELIEDCLPALDRKRSIALMAGEGSGIELLYGLAIERAIEGGDGIRALVLTASRSAAARCAAVINAFEPEGTGRALVWPPPAPQGVPPAGVAALAGRAGAILPEVRAGRVRLADLRLLVIDCIEAIELADDWASVETLMGSLEPGTPKIVSCLGPGERLAELLTHRLTRAYRWPTELFDDAAVEHSGPSAPVSYAAAPGFEERLDLLAAALRAAGKEAAVLCADPAAGDEVARGLAARGLGAGDSAGQQRVRVWEPGGKRPETAVSAVFGLPPRLAALREGLDAGTHRIAIVPTRHLGQLLLLVRRAGWPVTALSGVSGWPDLDPIERFRALVAEEVQRVDAAAELLLLEPLLEEHGTVPVAAALASLLRRRPAGRATVKQWPDMEADSGLTAGPLPAVGGERGTRPAWTKIYVGVGRRDGARAGDLVGALTGETGIVGGQIGKVEMRGNFTLIDIDSQVVDDVIRKLDGSIIKGRTVSVRLDREA